MITTIIVDNKKISIDPIDTSDFLSRESINKNSLVISIDLSKSPNLTDLNQNNSYIICDGISLCEPASSLIFNEQSLVIEFSFDSNKEIPYYLRIWTEGFYQWWLIKEE